jgi:YHS domain-containing protein
MNRNIRPIILMFALAAVLVIGIAAQQKSADTAVDPVCGMTVVKANARATFDYKGTMYYFCSTGCKESFAKDPEKYLQPPAKTPTPMGGMQMRHMSQGQAQAPAAEGAPMAGCPMMSQGGMMRHGMGPMGMMHSGMGMPGRGMMAPGVGQLLGLYGDKIEVAVENTKDGAALRVTSKDPEVVKAIQVHMAEHVAMMKKMKDAAAKAPAAATGVKSPGEAACANCPMMKK